MKFQWYIVDLEKGNVQGTNDVELAKPFMENDAYLIFTAQHGLYYCGSTVEHDVEKIADNSDYGDDEDDD